MLKIKKGIKKKIKGKKDKGKEDDLFDPDQLEKYKKELEEKRRAAEENGEVVEGTSSTFEKDEEWQKFQQLTSGVDTILKKTSEELGKIKETSFYQRKSTDPTNLWKGDKPEAEEKSEEPEAELGKEGEEEQPQEQTPEEEEFKVPDIVDVEPEELDDSLFDTSYLDAIAAGEIQLAYIPESPTEEQGDDPFDTSGVADVVKRIEEAEKKAKRQVDLGAVVDVLSGKATEAPAKRARPKAGETKKRGRPRPVAVNLLGEFDEEGNPITDANAAIVKTAVEEEPKKGILDDILGSPQEDAAVLGEVDPTLFAKPSSEVPKTSESDEKDLIDSQFKDIIGEFDSILNEASEESQPVAKVSRTTDILKSVLEPEDEVDDEFAALAVESLHKSPIPPTAEEDEEPEEDDPFDTTFVEKVASEITVDEAKDAEVDEEILKFNPRVGESLAPGTVAPHPSPRSLLEDHSPTVENLPDLEPHFKAPPPTGTLIDSFGEDKENKEPEVDPFDTSTVKQVLPGKAELKLLEEELLKEADQPLRPKIPQLPVILSAPPPALVDEDDDFDPRADEVKEEKKEPDHLFDLPHDEEATDVEPLKVLTPQGETTAADVDPFDTSIVDGLNLGPGQLELKLLADELVQPTTAESIQQQVDDNQGGLKRDLSDPDFDPRGGEEPDPFVVTVHPKSLLNTEDIFESEDSLAVGEKPLTPQQEIAKPIVPEPADDFEDPFDTSAIEVSKLLPASELKQIEGEILNAVIEPIPAPKPLPTVPSTIPPPRPVEEEIEVQPTEAQRPESLPHLLEADDPFGSEIDHKPLTPLEIQAAAVDPFDTSIAEKVVPGKTEIKILEEELQLGVDSLTGRRLSDPDFDPRGTIAPQPVHPASLSFVSKILEPVKISDSSAQSKPDEAAEDPFDTSAASAVISESNLESSNKTQPDLKALEAELL